MIIFNRKDTITAQKIKFYIKDFFSKYDQIRSYLLKKSLMKNFIFCAVYIFLFVMIIHSRTDCKNGVAMATARFSETKKFRCVSK